MNIHAKPGYDPCELFIDPKISFPKMKIIGTLLKKHLGFRYQMEVIPLDAGLVRGSHGRVNDNPDDGPVFMTTEPKLLNGSAVHATDVCNILLDHVFRVIRLLSVDAPSLSRKLKQSRHSRSP